MKIQARPAGVASGVSWSAVNASVLKLGQFAVSIVAARIIAPDQFGIFAVALTVLAIIANVSDLGTGSAIVRDPARTPRIAPTVATIALFTSTALTTVVILSAAKLSAALGAAEATTAVQVLALTMVIGAFGVVPSAILTRDYRQRDKFAADLGNFVVSSALLVVLAMSGFGVMALAWSRLAGQLVATLLIIALVKERYRPGVDWAEAGPLLRFSLPLAGANLIAFGIANVDFMVIGRMRGALQLGYYNLAFTISSWPMSIFTGVLSNVTLTTLSRARSSTVDLERHLGAALSALAATAFPISALSMALANPLIATVYGERWAPAAAALVTLSLFGATRVVVSLLSDLLVALGLTRRLLVLQGVWLAVLVPAMVVGVKVWGIAGAGLANAAVALLVMIPAYLLASTHRSGLRLGWMIKPIAVPTVAAAAAGSAAWIVTQPIESSTLVQLLVGGCVGVVTFVLLAWRWLRRLRLTLRSLYGNPSDSGDDDASPELEVVRVQGVDLGEST